MPCLSLKEFDSKFIIISDLDHVNNFSTLILTNLCLKNHE